MLPANLRRSVLFLVATMAVLAVLVRPSAAVPLSCTATPAGAPAFTVELVSPLPGEAVACQAVVAGEIYLAARRGYDIYIIIDSSGSTAGASGLDLDGDGLLGTGDWRSNTDPGDSTLHAELEAVRRALASWEGLDVRVSIAEFSAVIPIPPGEPAEQGRIRTVQGLTANLDLVRTGLDVIAAAGSVGATDYGGALLELAAEFDRSADPTRYPVAFFLSDGKPTFPRYPYDSTEPPDLDWMRTGAAEVASRGLPTNTLEVGVFDDIGALAEVAATTGGYFLPALEREGLLNSMLTVNLEGFGDARLANATSGDVTLATLAPSGSFSATIDLEDGANTLMFEAGLTTPDGQWDIACPFEITASCTGCTYTQGYWKTHNRYSPRASQNIPWPIDEDTSLCGQTWLEIFGTSPSGDAWYILAHQWIAARLNEASGASVMNDIAAALAEGEAILSDCVVDPAERARALEISSLLDAYNNGVVGPGHCGDTDSSQSGASRGQRPDPPSAADRGRTSGRRRLDHSPVEPLRRTR